MAGASPNFSDIHIIRTLIALKKQIGRKKLLQEIGIGEGSMRTILKKLKNKGFITSTKKGHALTNSGEEYLNKYLEKFTIPFKIHSSDIVPYKKTGIIIRNAHDNITNGIAERDIAVRTGALGALVLEYKDESGRLKFPGDSQLLESFPEFKSEIETIAMNAKFMPKDVFVVSFGEDYTICENAVISIAISLIRQPIDTNKLLL